MIIKNLSVKTVIKPLKVLFSTSLGSKEEMMSVLVKITLDNGSYGLGECPTSFVSKLETIEAIKEILTYTKKQIQNKPIEDFEEIVQFLRRRFFMYPMTVSGIEVALFRAYLNVIGIDEYTYWGARLKNLETDITIPFLTDLNAINSWLNYGIKKGFKIFKLKLSGDVIQDILLLSKVNEILNDSTSSHTIRLDGNQGFTEKTFLKLQDIMEKKGYIIQCFEQPLKKNDFSGMKVIKKYSHIPIILDETVFSSCELNRVISENICDGVNIKVAKSGILESKRMIEIAKRHKLKLMIGCMTETMIGLSAGIYLACGTGQFDFVDLDSIYYIRHKRNYGNINLVPPFFFINWA
ncbi:MAG TPA: enolase C-terminal domain-like protein [Syntrophorhabdaceae bacterium]|nr:enolase C-terminal domain-like protein [Syntrophorhabdaceae bacterium]HPU29083.1 enolase C-terminal domain-like protein [Syntrophorhabdaceae bacterium]